MLDHNLPCHQYASFMIDSLKALVSNVLLWSVHRGAVLFPVSPPHRHTHGAQVN